MPAKSPSFCHQFHLGTLSEDLDKLPERMRDHNVDHHALRHINRDTFHLNSELGTELIATTTVRHYMNYHLALCANDDNPSSRPANPEAFCVLNHDINSRTYLRAGEVAITHVELLDYYRLKEAEMKSNVKWRMKRVDEKVQKEKEAGGLVKVLLDVFVKKRKHLQHSADEFVAMNSKKPRIEEELEDGETLEPPMNPMNVDGTNIAGPSGSA
ncbi:hypothetical protein B0H13DRAFT_1909702 [Mycena leptocephala]|nr:hypothetical protein B0H13DRAFT_1909702 [Mycena leptocephala]